MNRLDRWARGWLWSWAAILAFFIVISLIVGDWSSGVAIGQWIIIVLLGAFFVRLIWAGWVEWRERRDADGNK